MSDRAIPDKIHIVGICGAATSGLAMLLRDRNHEVSGSDQDGRHKEMFLGAGIRFIQGHDVRNVPKDAGLVIRSAAVPVNNAEVAEARRLGIEVLLYSEVLGRLAATGHAIAVAGTHGKTSTTGMLTSIMIAAGRDPSVIIGGELEAIGGRNWRNGNGEDFIVEACEFQRSFLNLSPSAGIITNIEVDHPEIYCNLDAVQQTFRSFLEGFRTGAPVVIPELHADRLSGIADVEPILFGLDQGPGWRSTVIEDGLHPLILISHDGVAKLEVRLSIPGRHTILNATAAVALAAGLDVNLEWIQAGIESYRGVKRRFERRDVLPGVEWFEDYAHHPTEVSTTLETGRGLFPDRKIWAMFQPHQATRLQHFLNEFTDAFDCSDEVLLLPIYHVREDNRDFPTDLLSQFAARLRARGISTRIIGSKHAVYDLQEIVRPGDVVFSLGAGDIDKIGTRIREEVASVQQGQPG
ncbi:MAG: UDP-N-acetylmuramate--L-alanine ligase [Bacillota bacterium]|nr:MAG: UDP-N-acetylmuramate--L-alanine ligase [Bacillota bacterium]